MGISVDPQRGVLIAAPADVPLSRLDAVVHRKARWIVDRLRRVNHVEAGPPAREFVSGESYLYLGRHYRLKVEPGDRAGTARLVGGWIHVPVWNARDADARRLAVQTALDAWYRHHAADRLRERVSQWARKLSVPEPDVVIRGQQRRWASCDHRSTLRFNWRIVQAPMRLVDYVVAHELVHLRHKDHSKAFWATIGKVMPDYERRREELRRLGPRLGW